MADYDALLAEPEKILRDIEDLLRHHPDGISEYELMTKLASSEPFFGRETAQGGSIQLFQRHFLLFHFLYQLRIQYLAEQSGLLEISALCIKRLPYEASHQGLQPNDPLQDYYLDISQLHETAEDDVDELLARFWLALSRRESRSEALAILGLVDPVDDATIRQAYRRLVMQHHPDRGGDLETIQSLNQAIGQLLADRR